MEGGQSKPELSESEQSSRCSKDASDSRRIGQERPRKQTEGIAECDDGDAPDSERMGRQEGAREGIQPQEQIAEGQDVRNCSTEGYTTDAPDSESRKSWESPEREGGQDISRGNQNAPDSTLDMFNGCRQTRPEGRTEHSDNGWEESWIEIASRLCTLDDGLPPGLARRPLRNKNRVQRLKAAGNSIVPQIAFELMQGIINIEGEKR